jgi:glutaredoxin-like YruB-family protein
LDKRNKYKGKMKKYLSGIVIVIFLLQGISFADYYKWEDEKGEIHVTDYPPPAQTAKNTKVHQFEPEPVKESPSVNQENQKSSKQPSSAGESRINTRSEVILYSTSWCPYCKKARNYFNSLNISYTDYDIDKDKDAAERLKQRQGNTSIPFVIINGTEISGFSPGEYERALQKNP